MYVIWNQFGIDSDLFEVSNQLTINTGQSNNNQLKYAEIIFGQFGMDSDLIEASNLHQPFKEKSGKQKIRYSINKYIQSYVFCIYDN